MKNYKEFNERQEQLRFDTKLRSQIWGNPNELRIKKCSKL